METHVPSQQTIEEGVGPAYHRIYSVVFAASYEASRKAMQLLQVNTNEFSPQLLAKFEKLSGQRDRLAPGDEFQIYITGPWNGPVRVAEVSPDHFRLVTLEGHLEAGEINFRIKKEDSAHVRFEIESLARSRDMLVDLVYDKVPVAKLCQTQMWKTVCKAFAMRAVEIDKGKPSIDLLEVSAIDVRTEKLDPSSGKWVAL